MGRLASEDIADDLVALQEAQTFLEVGSDLLDTADVRRIVGRLRGIGERLKADDFKAQDAASEGDSLEQILRAHAPQTMRLVRSMTEGSAERYYSARYAASRMMDSARPAVADYGLAASHADDLRADVDRALAADRIPAHL